MKETYAHLLAKKVIIDWLREEASKNESVNFADSIIWRVNRDAPTFGVFDEYPLTSDFEQVWDEQYNNDYKSKEYPDYDWMIKNGYKNFKIADIVIQHKGMITYILEIVHKNDLTEEKINFYKNLPTKPEVFRFPTSWVLGQINVPKIIPSEFKVL